MQQTETDLDNILAKLASLKTLAEKPGSAGEAVAATAAIQRLLFRHNLTMADVKDKREEFVDVGFRVNGDIRDASSQKWKAQLLAIIARANFCRTYSRHRMFEKNAYVVGREHNVTVVIGMYQYLEAEAKRLCREHWRAEKFFGAPSDRRALFNRSFYYAFVHEIRDRLRAQVTESTQEAGAKGSALVIQAEREIEDVMARLHPELSSRRQSRITVSSDGLDAGRDAGRTVNLSKQVRTSQLALSR